MHINTIFGYQFKNTQLIRFALHHPSLAKNNEFQRLEFLGDRIINMEVALLIYAHYSQYREGEMSVLFSSLISGEAMDKIGRPHILPCIKCQKVTKNVIADTLEAVVAALYLDGADVRKIIRDLWYPHILNREEKTHKKNDDLPVYQHEIKIQNYKTMLNDIGGDHCKYTHTLIKDKDGKNYFYSSVKLFSFTGEGKGKSKREGDEKAAKHLLDQLHSFSQKKLV